MGKEKEINYDSYLPTAIRKTLAAKGITQGALAEAVGVKPGTISNYFNGERVPDAVTLGKIATALNVSADFLLGIDTESRSTEVSISNCADAVKILESLMSHTLNSGFSIEDAEWERVYDPVKEFYQQVCVKNESVVFSFTEKGIVQYFRKLKELQEFLKTAPPTIKEYESSIKRDLLNEAEAYDLLPF